MSVTKNALNYRQISQAEDLSIISYSYPLWIDISSARIIQTATYHKCTYLKEHRPPKLSYERLLYHNGVYCFSKYIRQSFQLRDIT